MKILFYPARTGERLDAVVEGDLITLNGVVLDFSPLQEGDVLPAGAVKNPWVSGEVRRIDGEVHLALIVPHGADAPPETLFPANFTEPLTVVSGPVPIPAYEVTHD